MRARMSFAVAWCSTAREQYLAVHGRHRHAQVDAIEHRSGHPIAIAVAADPACRCNPPSCMRGRQGTGSSRRPAETGPDSGRARGRGTARLRPIPAAAAATPARAGRIPAIRRETARRDARAKSRRVSECARRRRPSRQRKRCGEASATVARRAGIADRNCRAPSGCAPLRARRARPAAAADRSTVPPASFCRCRAARSAADDERRQRRSRVRVSPRVDL